VKVLDSAGNGSDSTVMGGLDWVATNGANLVPPIRVVNMSLGRAGQLNDNPALRAIVQTLYNQGITVVVAAGNEPDLEVSQQVPATYPEVLAIASSTALDGSNGRCRFFTGIIAADSASSFTTDGRFDPATGIGVTVSAPGEDRENVTRSCFAQSVGILSTKLGGGTTRLFGTSMAAPHAAGVVALMWEKTLLLNSAGLLHPEDARATLRAKAALVGEAPLDAPTTGYSFDGEREGILSAPSVLQ
jgi:subtilisin family serine protease